MKNLFKILFLILLCYNFTPAQYPEWEVVGKMPHPVSGGRAVARDSLIYLIGGYSDTLQANVNWIQEYNPAANEWKIVSKLAEKRYGFQAGIYNDNLYLFGGINEQNDSAYILESWNFKDTSTTIAAVNESFDRTYSSGVISGSGILIAGGYAGSRGDTAALPYIIKYDFIEDTVTVVDDTTYQTNELPLQQMGVKVGDAFYLFGGAYNGVLQSYDVMNLMDNSFIHMENREITPRAAGSAVYSEKYRSIYLIGGYNESNPSSTASVEIINPESDFSVGNGYGPSLNYARKNLQAVDFNGTIYVFGGEVEDKKVVPYIERLTDNVTAVREDALNKEPELKQNYPNPFNPATTIKFSVPVPGADAAYKSSLQTELSVYNILGEKIKTLVNKNLLPGNYEIKFEGNKLTSGIYLYRLKTGNIQITKKMLLLK